MNCGGVLKSTPEPGASGERGAGAGLIGRGERGCEEAWKVKRSTQLKGTLDNILDQINHSHLGHDIDV